MFKLRFVSGNVHMAELFDPEKYREASGGQALTQPYQDQPAYGQNALNGQYQENPYNQANPYEAQTEPVQPHAMQPQTPMHYMPVPPVFERPPGIGGATTPTEEGAPKASRFALKRGPKVKKAKKEKRKSKSEGVEPKKTSRPKIFIMGMATGILGVFIGQMVITNILTDNAQQTFNNIERRAIQSQQTTSPTAKTGTVAELKTP